MRVKSPEELLNNGTFCVLPWIHDLKHLDGKKYICCVSRGTNIPLDDDMNSESSRELRRKIYNGEKIPHCEICYKQEAAGVKSFRQAESLSWFNKDAETREYFSTLTANTPPKLFYYDIRYDSKCNLACVTCGHESSTLWKKELGIPIIEHDLKISYDEMRTAKKIYLAGGEPLVIDKHIELITWLSEHQPDIEIIINTNLMALKPEVVKILKKLNNLGLVISIDSWGKSLEYVRYPLKWDKFLRNLDSIKEADISIYFNTVISAPAVFGWKELNKLDQYDPKDWFLFPLEYPKWAQVENIPASLKQQAYDCILPMKESKFYLANNRFKPAIDHTLTCIMNNGDSESLKNEILKLDTRRKINHSEYLEITFT